MVTLAAVLFGDGHANQGSGHLQPGFRPEPKIVYIWGLNGPDRPRSPCEKVEVDEFRLRPKPWLQMARTLVSVAVASKLIFECSAPRSIPRGAVGSLRFLNGGSQVKSGVLA